MAAPAITLDEAKERLKEATAPRVTEDSIVAKIKDVKFILSGITTICQIKMKNGFCFIGHSTPASPSNFDAQIGERYAYDNAFKQIWSHEGYLLRERLSEQEAHHGN